MSTEALIEIYVKAWQADNPDVRRELLEKCWREDGRYQDPGADVPGRAALVAHIGSVRAQFPGGQVELSSGISTHHDAFYFAWRLVLPDGTVIVEGVDFGTLGPDGMIASICGFFGPPGA